MAVRIGRRTISNEGLDPPYIVAEAGVNHEGDIEKAKLMIDQVARAGGDAIKFQAYRASTLVAKDSPAYWDTTKETAKSQYTLFRRMEGFWEREFKVLARHARNRGIDFMATPFDLESADFLEPLVPAYKIASADITAKPLIEHIAKKGKPILMSTGAASVSEVWRAIEWIGEVSDVPVVLLHCVLNYPTKIENASLGAIRAMTSIFPGHLIGYSDHTVPPHSRQALLVAWLLGAGLIEKHFTWDKTLRGNDHYHSFDFEDLRDFVGDIRTASRSIGKIEKHFIPSEESSRKFARRSLVATKRIPEGAVITSDDITWKRPGTGIPPWLVNLVVGGKATKIIEADEVLSYQSVQLRDGIT